MLKIGVTIKEATEKWIDQFNFIPQRMIEKLMENDPDEWEEITLPVVGDLAHVYDLVNYGEIIWAGKEDGERVYDIKMYGSENMIQTLHAESFFIERDNQLPMWGTMWSFKDSCDSYWLEYENGLEAMSKCGFRIYENAEFGYFFGIDGVGYDFYEAHWIPLYKARGLHWHDPRTEGEDNGKEKIGG